MIAFGMLSQHVKLPEAESAEMNSHRIAYRPSQWMQQVAGRQS
jgi:hypothetical protein